MSDKSGMLGFHAMSGFENDENEAYMATLEFLDKRKWDLMDELAAIELAKAAILNRIRGFEK